jgi:hypothetical protein
MLYFSEISSLFVRRFILITCLTLFLPTGLAHSHPVQNISDTTSSAEKVELLEQQTKLLKKHTSELQSSVQWAVGGIFTLVAGSIVLLAVIAGLNIFQYNRRYQEDKKAFREEVESHAKKEMENAKSELSDSIDEYIKELNELVDKKIEKQRDILDRRLNSAKKYLKSDIDRVKLNLKREEIRERLEGDGYVSDYILLLAAEALELTHTADHGFADRSDILMEIRKAVEMLDERDKEIKPRSASKLYDELENIEDYENESEDIKRIVREARS